MSTSNRNAIKNRNASVAAGIDKHVTSPITVGGTPFAPLDLKAVFTGHTAALDAAEAVHKQWADQLVVANAAGKKANATYQSLRSYLVGQYGKDANAILHDFGMEAPKPSGPKTVKTKAAAAEKVAATRAARHTMGKNQKKAVKGTITTIETPTPTTAAAVVTGGGASVPATAGTSAVAVPRVTTPTT